jgi:hypothetical protein
MSDAPVVICEKKKSLTAMTSANSQATKLNHPQLEKPVATTT